MIVIVPGKRVCASVRSHSTFWWWSMGDQYSPKLRSISHQSLSRPQRGDEPIQWLDMIVTYLNVFCSFWEYDAESVVLCKDFSHIEVKSVIQDEPMRSILKQVIPSWHVIALAPVYFPLSENGESRLNLEWDIIIPTEGIRWGDVTNKVPVVKATNVSGKRGLKALNCILSNLSVPVLIINTPEFSLNSSSIIEKFVILINKNVTPVRDFNLFLHLMENR